MMVAAMKAILLRGCLAMLPLLAAGACSDDEERKPPPFQSGVAADGPVAELSDADKRRLCDQYGAHLGAAVDLRQIAYAFCLPTSLLAGGFSEESCDAFLKDCVDNFPVTGRVQAGLNYDERACLASIDTCDVSVVELEGCVNVNLGLVYDILERLSCRRAGDEGLRSEIDSLNVGSVCAQPNRACGSFGETIY